MIKSLTVPRPLQQSNTSKKTKGEKLWQEPL
nr:MAG TPA: hypothetical protein [Caudoviricetes sp.]